MKILMVHNYYQQPGGEDVVFADEGRLLESHGHQVLRFTRHNDAVPAMCNWQLLRTTVWNRPVQQELQSLIQEERPDILHCHNLFPLISPSAYYAARAQGIPVVQTLHNYRLLCPSAILLRGGRICEDCVGKFMPWPGVLHACYRNSRKASAAAAAMLAVHRFRRTWTRMVDCYIALTEFARLKFIEGGIPSDRIKVKANFVDPDPSVGEHHGDYAMFAGRLSPEKGIEVVLAAWSQMAEPVPLKIVGDGPLRDTVRQACQRDARIEWLGHKPINELMSLIGNARMFVFPSMWHEPFGRTIVEAFAKGIPVVASHGAAMTELIDDGRTGLLFRMGDAADLVQKVLRLWTSPTDREAMGQAVRREYELKYGAEKNYDMLLAIYREAITARAQPVHAVRDREVLKGRLSKAACRGG